MLVMFPSILVADTKIIYCDNFVAPLSLLELFLFNPIVVTFFELRMCMYYHIQFYNHQFYNFCSFIHNFLHH